MEGVTCQWRRALDRAWDGLMEAPWIGSHKPPLEPREWKMRDIHLSRRSMVWSQAGSPQVVVVWSNIGEGVESGN